MLIVDSDGEDIYFYYKKNVDSSLEDEKQDDDKENNDVTNVGNDNIDDTNNDSIPNSPSTGTLELYVVLGIVIMSLVVGIYYYNQLQRKKFNIIIGYNRFFFRKIFISILHFYKKISKFRNMIVFIINL